MDNRRSGSVVNSADQRLHWPLAIARIPPQEHDCPSGRVSVTSFSLSYYSLQYTVFDDDAVVFEAFNKDKLVDQIMVVLPPSGRQGQVVELHKMAQLVPLSRSSANVASHRIEKTSFFHT
jgi:hypothetical protein